jgi:hypothetical protein
MADIVVTAASVAEYNAAGYQNIIRSRQAAAAVSAGQAVYYDTAGKANPSDADSATLGARAFGGIALETKALGETVRVLEDGWVYGYTLTSQAYGAPIYLSATAGALADAADPNGGTAAGYVDWRNDAGGTFTKILRVQRAARSTAAAPTSRVIITLPTGAAIHAAASGIVTLWTNPEPGTVLITRAILNVTTASSGACTVAIGTTAASAVTSSNNLFDALSVAAAGAFDSSVSGGTAGLGTRTLATGKWVTLDEASGDATGLVATLILDYIIL